MLSAIGWRAGAALGVLLGLEGVSFAQTWIPPRERPSLSEIVAVDATGETVWAYGEEDVEAGIDIRTAYAATDPTLFYVRMYFSDGAAPATGVTGYVFIDADSNEQTGGPADNASIAADLPADPTPGGYDYVIGIEAGGTLSGIWEWAMAMSEFSVVNLAPLETAAEAGQDLDPIGFSSAEHGYLQASVELGAVGLTQACSARLFFRSLDASGASDADGGGVVPCTPADSNSDGIPDVVVVDGCMDDDDCPGGGICVSGGCYLATPCADEADCPDDESCATSGYCVVDGGGMCMDNAECGELVCEGGTCVACDPAADTCGEGRRCAPDGRCVTGDGGMGGAGGAGGGGVTLAPGDKVQGGACSCGLLGREGPVDGRGVALAAMLFALGWWRRGARRAGRLGERG